MTLTFCNARVRVVAARLSLLMRRAWAMTNAKHVRTAGITKNHSNRCPFKREACFCRSVPEGSWSIAMEFSNSNCLVIGSSRILWSQVLGFVLTAQHGKNDWDKEESCDGGEKEPADDRAAKRRILFASLAEPEGHGHHADDHRESGHHHRPQPGRAGLEGRAEGV